MLICNKSCYDYPLFVLEMWSFRGRIYFSAIEKDNIKVFQIIDPKIIEKTPQFINKEHFNNVFPIMVRNFDKKETEGALRDNGLL